MAIRFESADDRTVLRQVVAEIRWLLAHSAGVRVDLIHLVRRYEDALYGASVSDHSGNGQPHQAATTSRIIPFPRPPGEPTAPPTNVPHDSM